MILTIGSFVLVMGLIVFVHELGHFLVAKRSGIVVDEFGFGYPPRLIKLGERDGTVYSINAIPFGGFVRMRGEEDPSEPGSFAAASRLARTATLLAGPAMNLVLAILLFAGLAMMTGVPDTSRPGVVIHAIAPDSPAQQGGIQAGDRIVSADGVAIHTIEELQSYTAAHRGQAVTYEVLRVDPATNEQQVSKVVMTPRTNPPQNQGALGIQIGMEFRPAKVWEAAWAGLSTTGQIIWLTFQIPATLIREGRPISDAGFMGPVGIAATTGEVVRSAMAVSSVQPILSFVALLSTALAVTNLLPIPALDGGRLLFVVFEAIRRKRIEPSQEGLIHLVGFGLLLILVGLTTVHEIAALVTGKFPPVGIP
jgi:regulator of sigma E protease